MPTHSTADPDTDRVAYTYRPDADAWGEWKDTVPRSTALYSRLDTLLAYDTHNDLDELVASEASIDADADGVPVTMVRIRRRCASAVQSARAEGADDAAEALAEIQALATNVLESQ